MKPSPADRGRRVTSARVARALTQETLARLCGCSLRTVQRIESGATDAISSRVVQALNRVLNIPLRSLLSPSTRSASK